MTPCDSRRWNSSGQNTGVGSLSLLQGIFPTQGWSSVLWVDSLPAEPQGKPKNTGVCSLSLLQAIFPTQASNWGLLHCRQILYQLSYEESPLIIIRSDQIRSVTQSCPTLCDPINRSTPGLPVHHQLPEFTQTHVHRVSEAIQPSHPLASPSPPAPKSLPASQTFPMSQLFT